MATFGELKTRVSNDLVRPNLLTEIGYAINEAIRDYSSERFWFNQSRSVTFNTVASQRWYTSSDNASIPNLAVIDQVICDNDGDLNEVPMVENWWLETVDDGTTEEEPTMYAYFDRQMRLYPVPDGVYAIRVVGIVAPTELSADSETNVFTLYAPTLIRLSAKRRIYAEVMKDPAKAELEAQNENLARMRLLRETSMRAGPVVVSYDPW